MNGNEIGMWIVVLIMIAFIAFMLLVVMPIKIGGERTAEKICESQNLGKLENYDRINKTHRKATCNPEGNRKNDLVELIYPSNIQI